MQSLVTSISPRGMPFTPGKEMPRGGGLPLCLSGVCILAQVPQKSFRTVWSSSSRSRSRSASVSSVSRSLAVRAALDVNAAESRNGTCDTEARSCEDSDTLSSGPNARRSDEANAYRPIVADVNSLSEAHDHRPNEANVHRPRFAVAQEMVELDRRRESLKKRRSMQGWALSWKSKHLPFQEFVGNFYAPGG